MKYIILLLITNICYADNIFGLDLGLDTSIPSKPPEKIDQPFLDIVANKTTGTITVKFPDNREEVSYALFGKQKSNDLNLDDLNYNKKLPSVTPAGTFKVKRMFSWHLNREIMAFVIGKEQILAIHPLWLGNPKQNRVERLKSPTPDDNRITNGCINVDPWFYDNVLSKAPDGSTLTILAE